jgi:hypothetical protein
MEDILEHILFKILFNLDTYWKHITLWFPTGMLTCFEAKIRSDIGEQQHTGQEGRKDRATGKQEENWRKGGRKYRRTGEHENRKTGKEGGKKTVIQNDRKTGGQEDRGKGRSKREDRE